jgi:hypothetical protein
MPDASGLNQQQGIAAGIPYKNIALGNPAETFLNAWALSTGIKLKKDELQGKMQALALKNAQLEADGELREKKYALDLTKAQLTAAHQGNMYDLAVQRANNDAYYKDQTSQLAYQKYNDLLDGQTSLLQLRADASAKNLRPGDPGYHDFMVNGANTLRGKLPASVLNKFNTDVDKDETAGIELRQKALASREKEFMHRYSNTVYGTQANTDLRPITQMETQTQPEYAPRSWSDAFHGVPAKPTDKRIITIKDQQGKVIGTSKVATQQLTDFAKEYQSIQQEKASIPQPPSAVGTMVNIRTSDGRTGPLPLTAVDEAKKRDPGLVIIP